ncbi:hypothetical protein J5N97_020670 [Dioscorea zingiberensis]|uniref:Uncharacterized protein n=1 Tax=Dioscorea zingiberensis TaxID=325984 RepID=A0A9D5CG88_9LILI|nr:hypothetical protein J5N97_020670 [Dioscorea zingiberensis]
MAALAGEGEAPNESSASGVMAKVEEQWRRVREHAETYPYVWGSYILVYGGIGVYLTYRWRKLRRTEDRVRALQNRLRQLVDEEAAASPPAGSDATTPSSPAPHEQNENDILYDQSHFSFEGDLSRGVVREKAFVVASDPGLTADEVPLKEQKPNPMI